MIDDAITVAITGASGGAYGLRLVQSLLAAEQRVYLLISEAGRLVLKMEEDLALPGRNRELATALCRHLNVPESGLTVFGAKEWTAPVASGSGAPARMAVCPCTTGSLARIAAGTSDGLIERAADVVLKERGRLVLVPRETPLSEIHLENMLRLTRMGAVMLPANPGFYNRPESVTALVDFVVARVLDQLGVANQLAPRWGQPDD
ncbi:UbiX family flavin prenyltransferase [Arhodomonas sp. AD133]|uniref:UbiX family flavin prenyltransferase n=1 Tax=Arhodomonas sp. AD133 TaxID=3415009 RepID=UPI003EBFA738